MSTSLSERFTKKVIDWMAKDKPAKEIPVCDFERIRYEIRPCDVLLIEGRSRVSEVIKLVSQSCWSHAALYIGRLHDIENPILRKRVIANLPDDVEDDAQLLIESMLGKGTVIVPLTAYQQDHIRICRPKGISRQDAQHVMGYSIGRLGIEYDIRHILDLARFLFPWSFLPRRWRSTLFEYSAGTPTRQICSALIAEAFGAVKFPVLPLVKPAKGGNGVKLIPRNPKLTTPSDFDYSPYFEIIKYPIFELSNRPVYRDLPWTKQGIYSNDEEGIYVPGHIENEDIMDLPPKEATTERAKEEELAMNAPEVPEETTATSSNDEDSQAGTDTKPRD